jgi:hypothetical protein
MKPFEIEESDWNVKSVHPRPSPQVGPCQPLDPKKQERHGFDETDVDGLPN